MDNQNSYENESKRQVWPTQQQTGITSETGIANFVHLIRHYVCVKQILTPEQGFEYIESFISGKNPFQESYYLKMIIKGMRECGFGPLYLANDYLKSAYFQQLWESVKE